MASYIPNIANNRLLYKKAYLIDFMSEDNITPEATFTFSVPPESEEITYTQRKTEVKTFGGLHVDDYGIDAVKIVLSGSTINQDLKMIYRGKESNKWLTGEEEIYYLRDLIREYKTGTENFKKQIIIYDLSKTNRLNKSGKIDRGNEDKFKGATGNIKNYWRAFIGDFKIRRASDRPFCYKYTLEFTGVPLHNNNPFKPLNLDEGKAKWIMETMNGLTLAVSFMDDIKRFSNKILSYAGQFCELNKMFGDIMTGSSDMVIDIINSMGNSIVGIIGGIDSTVKGRQSIISLPRTLQTKVLNIGSEIQNTTKNLMKSVDELIDEVRVYFDGMKKKIPQEVLNFFQMIEEDYIDVFMETLNKLGNAAYELYASAKSSYIPEIYIRKKSSVSEDDEVVKAYGYYTVTLDDTDTLESLAFKYIGNPDNAIDIAIYNNIASLDELEAGNIIKIPILNYTQKAKNNQIFAIRENMDNYGSDISLTEKGEVIVSNSGDYKIKEGAENLAQAILLRLRESISKRIRVNVYGIKANIGDPDIVRTYIISSIDATVNSDPRIKTITDIKFTSKDDASYVEVYYIDINNNSKNIIGRV